MIRYSVWLAIGIAFAGQAQTVEDRKLLDEAAAIDRQLERSGMVYHNPEIEKYLADLAQPLLPSKSPGYVHWQFRILREPLINAFSLPNGSVYVHTGLLAMTENDDELAGVLAHEITHTANQHLFQFRKSYRKRVVAMEALAAAVTWMPVGGTAGLCAWFAANTSEFMMATSLLGYSRALEREADENAVELLPKAHRDPATLVRTFELFDERLDPEPVPLFWRDHPKTKERIAYIKKMTGAPEIEHPAADPAYVERMRPVILQNIRLDLDSRRFRTAVARAQRLVDTRPNDPESLYWLGEAYRSLGPRSVQPSEKERTDYGQNNASGKMLKRTEEEEARALAATAEGKAALASNRAKAGECFRRAGDLPKAHLGFGMLYEDEQKKQEALGEYRRYLELAPDAADRVRVERRVEALAH